MKLEPTEDFGQLTDKQIAEHGVERGKLVFEANVRDGFTNNDSLVIVAGFVTDGVWLELVSDGVGPDFRDFAANVSPQTGKLATALDFHLNSIEAVRDHPDKVGTGPRLYTGAVFHTASVETVDRGWMTQDMAAAASGVQGHLDQVTSAVIVYEMEALWALRAIALYGKPTR